VSDWLCYDVYVDTGLMEGCLGHKEIQILHRTRLLLSFRAVDLMMRVSASCVSRRLELVAVLV